MALTRPTHLRLLRPGVEPTTVAANYFSAISVEPDWKKKEKIRSHKEATGMDISPGVLSLGVMNPLANSIQPLPKNIFITIYNNSKIRYVNVNL